MRPLLERSKRIGRLALIVLLIAIPDRSIARMETDVSLYRENGDGTVTYAILYAREGCEAVLRMWTKNANLPGRKLSWNDARKYIRDMNSGRVKNFGHTDWTIPSRQQIEILKGYKVSLLGALGDTSGDLPEGHPFENIVQGGNYWYKISGLDMLTPSNDRYLWPLRIYRENITDCQQ